MNPKYIDLRSASLEVKAMDLEMISRLIRPSKYHPLEFNLKDYDPRFPDIMLIQVDFKSHALWTHIAVAHIVCEILGVSCPKTRIFTHLRLAQETACRHGVSPVIEKVDMNPELTDDRMKVVRGVLEMENHLALIAGQ